MTHDEMMNLLANTLADAAGSSGCLPILDCFSPHPGEEVTVSIPMCDDTVDIVLEDLDFPHEWEELLENSGADTMGDLVDYLCYCSQNNICTGPHLRTEIRCKYSYITFQARQPNWLSGLFRACLFEYAR